MQLKDFWYQLPEELIAQYPMDQRTHSRLLVFDPCAREIQHAKFHQLANWLNPDDLLVFNNTKVMKARLHGQKTTGGRVELLIERLQKSDEAQALIKASKPPQTGSQIMIGSYSVEVLGKSGQFYQLKSLDISFPELLETAGEVPLPPYMKRPAKYADESRYQTVYAEHQGAVAAPTAGLHFDQPLLNEIENMGIQTAFVTLHVGSGTFLPVRAEQIENHVMHSERFEVDASVYEKIETTRKNGARVIAVGTTVARALESEPGANETRIFIMPGYAFKRVDALITNFHLPESTLLMLVSAFAGRDNIMKAYEVAIQEKYRFFSYGDAMFITRTLPA